MVKLKSMAVCGISILTLAAIAHADGRRGRDGRWVGNRDGFARDHGFDHWDRVFGIPGTPGADGANGYSGTPGRTPSPIFLNASSPYLQLDLSGGNGGQGGNGRFAEPAQSCYQFMSGRDRFAENLTGAPGADGGDAGQGGAGGPGGDLTLYYTDESDLRKVYVNASGGAPGANGNQPGQGAPGCRCSTPVWETRIPQPDYCEDVVVSDPPSSEKPKVGPAPSRGDQPKDPQGRGGPGRTERPKDGPAPAEPAPPASTHVERRCRHVPPIEERHFCFDGYDGQDGEFPPQAPYGQTGALTLIRNSSALSATNPSYRFALSAMPQDIVLSRDNWATLSGAASRLAAGSIIADRYTEWQGRVMTESLVSWKANRSNADLGGVGMSLAINSDGSISPSYDSSQVWLQFDQESSPANAAGVAMSKLQVKTAILPSEAQAFSVAVTGNKGNTVLTLTDANGLSDLLDTVVTVHIESKGVFWHTNFKINDKNDDTQRLIPGTQIQQVNARQFVVPVGKIYPSGNMGDLNPGKEMKFTVRIQRSLKGGLGNQSNDSVLYWQDKLSK